MYFEYGDTEIEYLKSKCPKLACAIDKIGIIKREMIEDLFVAVVYTIVGQQISSKALETIWKRFEAGLGGNVNTNSVTKAGVEKLHSFGVSSRKAEYIFDFAQKIKKKEFDIEAIFSKSDEEVIKELTKLKGIGVWTAEMLLLFCMGRRNVFSYDDLGIRKGLCILYHHRKITKPLFEKYRRKFSPYCSVASLYLWEIAGGKG